MRALEGSRAHLAHLQFHAYGGDDWADGPRSRRRDLAEYFNAHPELSADAGQVLFGNTVTITADGPWQHLLYKLTGRKWGNLDVENETGCGIVPYATRRRTSSTPCSGPSAWSCCCSSTTPGGSCSPPTTPTAPRSCATREIIHLLMDRDFRNEQIKKRQQKAIGRTVLRDDLEREYTLGEIAIVTRAGPARLLGLAHKGHLGVGADADVTIYNENADREEMFSSAALRDQGRAS